MRVGGSTVKLELAAAELPHALAAVMALKTEAHRLHALFDKHDVDKSKDLDPTEVIEALPGAPIHAPLMAPICPPSDSYFFVSPSSHFLAQLRALIKELNDDQDPTDKDMAFIVSKCDANTDSKVDNMGLLHEYKRSKERLFFLFCSAVIFFFA